MTSSTLVQSSSVSSYLAFGAMGVVTITSQSFFRLESISTLEAKSQLADELHFLCTCICPTKVDPEINV